MSEKINLGIEVHDFENGRLNENIPLKYFKGNLLISGGARNERISLLSHVLNQFYTEFPDIGVLLIQLGSNEDTYLYHLDKVYEYGDPELVIPYSTSQQVNAVIREWFMRHLNAIYLRVEYYNGDFLEIEFKVIDTYQILIEKLPMISNREKDLSDIEYPITMLTLKYKNGGGYWEIHPEYLKIRSNVWTNPFSRNCEVAININ